VHLVHGSVDRGYSGARGGGSSLELGLAATPEHGSTSVAAQQREGDTRSRLGPHRGSGNDRRRKGVQERGEKGR
jgi:hypothetical protein